MDQCKAPDYHTLGFCSAFDGKKKWHDFETDTVYQRACFNIKNAICVADEFWPATLVHPT